MCELEGLKEECRLVQMVVISSQSLPGVGKAKQNAQSRNAKSKKQKIKIF